MKIGYGSLFLLSTMVLTIAGCRTASPTASVEASPKWVSNMHQLSGLHLRLMPLASNPRAFADPANRERIAADLQEMVQVTGRIVKDRSKPGSDPIINYSAARFGVEVGQAYRTFQVGDFDGARHALGRATGYCISCHTRTDRGHDFPFSWTPQFAQLTPSDRVDLLLANRRYAAALVEAKQMARDAGAAADNPRAWMSSLERVMAMLVRVWEDPSGAADLARGLSANRGAPFYMRNEASAWIADIRDWKKDGKNQGSYGEAIRLKRLADRSGAGSERAALILNLRASADLHRVLENEKSKQYGEALLLAGLVSQSLSRLNMGFLDQFYFASCIRHEPHSELAERCYERLDASMRAANPVLDIDPGAYWSDAAELAELRKMAEIRDVTQEPRWQRRPWERDDPPKDGL